MSSFSLNGPAKLSGQIPVLGSKNAALPLLAATLLTGEEVTLHNIPPIRDTTAMQEILTRMGALISTPSEDTLTVKASTISADNLPEETVRALRGSILLLGALLGRTGRAALPLPGGDIIGARPIDVHLDAFEQLGAVVTLREGLVEIDGENMKAGRVVLGELSVTATENTLLAAATLPGTTTIEMAAAEPHVAALAHLLSAMGATVEGAGTHRITITGSKKLSGAEFSNIPDMLEAGFFILLAAALGSELTVTSVPVNDLLSFFKKIDYIGVKYEMEMRDDGYADVTVSPSSLRSFSIKTLPHPGLATDLQAPFGLLATQVEGNSLIHDPMYEARFRYIHELQKMGAKAVICDPHRVIITGPSKLSGKRIPSLDIRAGATLMMAGLLATGNTIIEEAEIIERGYARLPERLRAIGADINVIAS
ncbi:MAG: UDP-N-acetylglucosamine 1-carboxyvinyltransferase [Candidatus Andersenbacteria bacterium]|nr:UDP-N-acetylglucosamine 1-carboxyvinyltransferase [Candidatus Andersenbacteria bacterium]MBI3250328.1 UDP-N-acetylglucosamine 1-carboxyvinyltransferase [Candidatus Andersenbacteria bacterium]